MNNIRRTSVIASDALEKLLIDDTDYGPGLMERIHDPDFGEVIITNMTLGIVLDRISKLEDKEAIVRARGLLFRRPDLPPNKGKTLPFALAHVDDKVWTDAKLWYSRHSEPLFKTKENTTIINLDLADWCNIGMIKEKKATRVITKEKKNEYEKVLDLFNEQVERLKKELDVETLSRKEIDDEIEYPNFKIIS